MSTLRTTIMAAVLPVLVFASSRALALEEWVWEMLRTCYQGRPTADELSKRLKEAIATHRGTHVEDDLLLAVAKARIAAGHAKEAIPILEGLIEDEKARKIDMVNFWVGWRTKEMIEVRRLYEKSPDLTADHALLTLAYLHLKRGNAQKSWQTFEELRAKYPRGDRVQEDLLLMEQFRKTHPRLPQQLTPFRLKAVPANSTGKTGKRYVTGTDPRAGLLSEEFTRRRRPHLRGLQDQAALCHKMGRSSQELVGILKDIVSIYDPLLTEDELTDYCRQGVAEIESLRGKAEGAALERLEEARKVFTQALERLAEEKKESPGKEPGETGAAD